jgi:hypothetical protein
MALNVTQARGERAEVQAATSGTEEGVRRGERVQPGSRGTPKRSKIREQCPEEFARTPGGNRDESGGVSRIRGAGGARGGGRRRRRGITATTRQQKAVQGELHTARWRLAALLLLARLLLPLLPPAPLLLPALLLLLLPTP